jgi:hypothetical protein
MASYQRVPLFPRSSPALTRRRQIPKSFPASRWKENLRQACLENARKRRRDLVMRKRGQHSLSETNNSELIAKNLIMEQCQKYGVGLRSSSFDDNSSPVALASSASFERRESTGQGDCMDVELETKFLDSGGSALTEDDLFEILREVEEELRIDGKLNTCRSHRACYHISFSRLRVIYLTEELLFEEVLEAENEYLESQINDYEKWEGAMDPEGCVPCPICKTSFLIASPEQEIGCSDEFCPLRIRSADVEQPLVFFKDELRMLHESHSSQCSDALAFSISSSTHGSALLAACDSCKRLHRFE